MDRRRRLRSALTPRRWSHSPHKRWGDVRRWGGYTHLDSSCSRRFTIPVLSVYGHSPPLMSPLRFAPLCAPLLTDIHPRLPRLASVLASIGPTMFKLKVLRPSSSTMVHRCPKIRHLTQSFVRLISSVRVPVGVQRHRAAGHLHAARGSCGSIEDRSRL